MQQGVSTPRLERQSEVRGLFGRLLFRFRTFGRMLRDPSYRLPGRLKLMLVLVAAYTIFPFDIIPDIFIPLGFADDLALLGAALAWLNKEIDRYLARERR